MPAVAPVSRGFVIFHNFHDGKEKSISREGGIKIKDDDDLIS